MCARYTVDLERRVSYISTLHITARSDKEAERKVMQLAEEEKLYIRSSLENQISQTFNIMNVQEVTDDNC